MCLVWVQAKAGSGTLNSNGYCIFFTVPLKLRVFMPNINTLIGVFDTPKSTYYHNMNVVLAKSSYVDHDLNPKFLCLPSGNLRVCYEVDIHFFAYFNLFHLIFLLKMVIFHTSCRRSGLHLFLLVAFSLILTSVFALAMGAMCWVVWLQSITTVGCLYVSFPSQNHILPYHLGKL